MRITIKVKMIGVTKHALVYYCILMRQQTVYVCSRRTDRTYLCTDTFQYIHMVFI